MAGNETGGLTLRERHRLALFTLDDNNEKRYYWKASMASDVEIVDYH